MHSSYKHIYKTYKTYKDVQKPIQAYIQHPKTYKQVYKHIEAYIQSIQTCIKQIKTNKNI